MRIYCQSCHELIQAADIDLASGWGKCAACQDVFALSTILPGFGASSGVDEGHVERPFNARSVVEQSRDELEIFIPRQGFRATTLAMLGFAFFWLTFIAFWTAGALGAFFGGWPPKPAQIGFAAFSTPFWLIGFVMLGSVTWSAFGTMRLQLDRNEMRTQIRCLFYAKNRAIDLTLVQCARPYIVNQSNNSSESYGAEVIFEKGSFVLPVDDHAEAEWLIAIINEFLKTSSWRHHGRNEPREEEWARH